MNWSENIRLSRPLRGVSRLAEAPAEDWDALLRAREQAAYERGRRDAEAALNEQVVRQRAELDQLQKGLLQSLVQAVPQVVKETESALITLALEAAQRIVGGLPIDARLVEGVVLEALRQAEDNTEILIQLHPEDLALLRHNDSAVLKGVPDKGPLRFSASGDVTRGGCMVQTRFGLIDARREVKVEQLANTLAL